ncbi:MAG: hypothetical protein M1829_005233 [Trizodia sp. TS-e1964]|nr:MAG: hypothetical protein M1829_005233 [Trizodia sp. TS-e1964]
MQFSPKLFLTLLLPSLALASPALSREPTKSNTQIILDAVHEVQNSVTPAEFRRLREEMYARFPPLLPFPNLRIPDLPAPRPTYEGTYEAPPLAVFSWDQNKAIVGFFFVSIRLGEGEDDARLLRSAALGLLQTNSGFVGLVNTPVMSVSEILLLPLPGLKAEGWMLSAQVVGRIVENFEVDVSKSLETPAGQQVYEEFMRQLRLSEKEFFPLNSN